MCLIDMPRKATSYRLDDRVLAALDEVARDGNISANRYLENLLFSHLKQVGKLDMGAQPLGETRGSLKGEARGGKKKGAGKPKASPSAATVDPTDGDRSGEE
jgi:hypothetical protein